jgi:hypothetical protein
VFSHWFVVRGSTDSHLFTLFRSVQIQPINVATDIG